MAYDNYAIRTVLGDDDSNHLNKLKIFSIDSTRGNYLTLTNTLCPSTTAGGKIMKTFIVKALVRESTYDQLLHISISEKSNNRCVILKFLKMEPV